MKAVEFGSLFEFIRNGMSVRQDKSGDGLPITRIETISEAVVDATRVGYADLKEKDCSGWLLQPGDILFSHINSLEHIGKCAVYEGLPKKLVHGMNLLCLRPDKSKLTPQFGKYLIRSSAFRTRLFNYVNKAVNQASVSIGNLKPIEVCVPPLPDQKRIAAILDKADSIRCKRQKAVQLTEELLRSVFLEMFGDPVTNPKGWETRAFVEVCETRLGKMLDARQQTGEHLRPYLRNSNVQWDWIETSDLEQMDFNEKDRKKFSLKYGDVLICEGGEVGRAAIWRNQMTDCYFQKAIHRARPNQSLALPEYVMFWLWFMAKNGGFKDHVTSATIAHLTGEKLKEIQVALPPITLQHQFLRAYNSLTKLKTSTYKYQTHTERLFNSILQQVFNGVC